MAAQFSSEKPQPPRHNEQVSSSDSDSDSGTPLSQDFCDSPGTPITPGDGTPSASWGDFSETASLRRTPTKAHVPHPPRKPQAPAEAVSNKDQDLAKGGVVKDKHTLSAEKAKRLSKLRHGRGTDSTP
jgi:hypothetical protein